MKALRTSGGRSRVMHRVKDGEPLCGGNGEKRTVLVDTRNYPDEMWRWCEACMNTLDNLLPNKTHRRATT